jgi:hypothetical protein
MEHNQHTQVTDSQITDPIIKLLEDVRTRKTKVRILNSEDRIPSLYNDKTIKKSVSIEVTTGHNFPNFEKPIRWPRILKNLRSPDFPTAQQKIILNRLEEVPAYRVVTDAQEIVMATPRDVHDNNFFHWLYMRYYNLCVWTEDDGPVSLTFVFLNKEDAQLYLQDIGKSDPKSTEKINLNVEITNLANFYTSERTSSPGTKPVLLADLEEMKNIILDYIPKKLHRVHPKQKFSKTSYAGIPIYIVKPMVGKKLYKKRIVDYKITYQNTTCDKNIFFRLEDAYSAWDKFCEDNKAKKLPLIPEIEIYNLESYVLDLENSDIDAVKDNLFVATPTALKDKEQQLEIIANTDEPSLTEKVKQFTSTGSKKLVEFSKGMLWLLTSDTLPTEDNGW